MSSVYNTPNEKEQALADMQNYRPKWLQQNTALLLTFYIYMENHIARVKIDLFQENLFRFK